MTATAAQIAMLRRMVAEPTVTTYPDATIQAYIEAHPLMDERGEEPYTWDASTSPPTQTDNTDWIASYDLHAAAADIWSEKAAAWASQHDYTADRTTFHQSQVYDQMMASSRYHKALRATKTMRAVKHPKESTVDMPWIANLPEPNDL